MSHALGKPSIHGRPDPKTEVNSVEVSATEGALMSRRESDQLIVLGDGSAVHKGKRLTVIRSPHRKHHPDMQGRDNGANLPEGDSTGHSQEWSCGSEYD